MLFSKRSRYALATLGLTGALLTGCLAVTPVEAGALAVPAAQETQPVSAQTDKVYTAGAPSAETVETAVMDEDSALLYMREEEKLAHDVYVTLYEMWGLPVFDNISNAETQHMAMVLQALEAHGLTDPAAGNALGEFSNSELQALYDDLIAQGSDSIVAALTVGATIEDLDIFDLQEALETTTDDNVRRIFENLMRGSENHLRAFVSNLARYGETYEPQFMDADYFAAVVGDSGTAGGPRGRGGQRGRGRAINNGQ